MSEKIIQFEKTDDWYIRQSEKWSKRGDAIKSLLYINMAKGGGRKVELRKAAALYESGNFTPAVGLLTKMYRSGDRSGEVYALLIKALASMSRYRSALYFMNDAAENGAFGLGERGKVANPADFYRTLGDIRKRYPDYRSSGEVAEILYMLVHGLSLSDETMFGDMFLSDKEVACSDMVFKATGVLAPSRIDPSVADKLLSACDNNCFTDGGMPRYDVLSAEIVSLATLGRTDEANMRAEELLNFDLPENDVDLLKCAEAFIAAQCHEGAREYLEELSTVMPNDWVLYRAAVANIATGDLFTARDELTRLIALYPHDLTARKKLQSLPRENDENAADVAFDEAVYSERLSDEEEHGIMQRIETMLEFAAVRGALPENPDMENNIVYALRYADDSYIDYLANALTHWKMYKSILKDYLVSIEGALERKRLILYAMYFNGCDIDGGVDVFVYGYKKVGVPLPPPDCTGENMLRAYYYTYATYSVYAEAYPADLYEVFAVSVQELQKYSDDDGFIYDVSAAILSVCGADYVFFGMESKKISEYSDSKKVNKYIRLIKKACGKDNEDGGK